MKNQSWLRKAGLASAAAALALTVTPLGEGLPFNQTIQAEASTNTYQTIENLNLRSGASAETAVVTIIPKGAQVELVSKSGSWAEVRYGAKTGYVNSKFLSNIEQQKPAAQTHVTIDKLNLREGAGVQYNIITEIPEGEPVRLISGKSGWVKVSYGDRTGYVNSAYLKAVKAPAEEAEKYPAPAIEAPGTYIDGILIVNKEYALPSDYNPGVVPEAELAVSDMLQDAKEQGLSIKTVSGFRSYSYQAGLYDNYVNRYGQAQADTVSAKAGHSEHQAGLAFDFGSTSTTGLSESFADTAEGQWLADNAHKYGFILRYPEGKEHITGYQYEPWHFRYLGTENAVKVKDSGKALEEYLEIAKE